MKGCVSCTMWSNIKTKACLRTTWIANTHGATTKHKPQHMNVLGFVSHCQQHRYNNTKIEIQLTVGSRFPQSGTRFIVENAISELCSEIVLLSYSRHQLQLFLTVLSSCSNKQRLLKPKAVRLIVSNTSLIWSGSVTTSF